MAEGVNCGRKDVTARSEQREKGDVVEGEVNSGSKEGRCQE
jgi:hypothetical protein